MDYLDRLEHQYEEAQEKPKYWYFITIYECVLCGITTEYRERQYTKRPEKYEDRHNFYEEACPEHFL